MAAYSKMSDYSLNSTNISTQAKPRCLNLNLLLHQHTIQFKFMMHLQHQSIRAQAEITLMMSQWRIQGYFLTDGSPPETQKTAHCIYLSISPQKLFIKSGLGNIIKYHNMIYHMSYMVNYLPFTVLYDTVTVLWQNINNTLHVHLFK